MAATKNGRLHAASEPPSLGLLANGSSGGWSIDVDETTTGPDQWFVQIQGPSIHLYFEIPSLDVVEQLRHFLSDPPIANDGQISRYTLSTDELVVGGDQHTPVQLRRDAEFDDRFFLVVGSGTGPSVHYTLSGGDLQSVVAALEQVREDIDDV